jgi:hypothetical protein
MVAEDWSLGVGLAFRGRIRLTRRAIFLRSVKDGSLWYRTHTRDELVSGYAALREARSSDRRLAWGLRAAMPLFRLAHEHDIRRLTKSGTHRPQPPRANRRTNMYPLDD